MKLIFLTQQEAIQEFINPDEYALKLPKSNLEMVNPLNPTLDGYQDVFLNSFGEFTDPEKAAIEKYTEKLQWLNLDVKIIKTHRTHSLDITQTRKDIIVVSGGYIGEATFIHECYHVLSRKYPSLTLTLSKIFGFFQVSEQEINEESFLLNPDALVCNYAIEVIHKQTQNKYQVTPFVVLGLSTGLKVVGEETYFMSIETNYESLFENTSYTAHPEEICAEYFTLIQLGTCIFRKTPHNETILKKYHAQLKSLSKDLGFLQGTFPPFVAPQDSFIWNPEEE